MMETAFVLVLGGSSPNACNIKETQAYSQDPSHIEITEEFLVTILAYVVRFYLLSADV
jgi:hypothetical protein